MVVTLPPERICYCDPIHRWILNIGAYHLWYETKEEAEAALHKYLWNVGLED